MSLNLNLSRLSRHLDTTSSEVKDYVINKLPSVLTTTTTQQQAVDISDISDGKKQELYRLIELKCLKITSDTRVKIKILESNYLQFQRLKRVLKNFGINQRADINLLLNNLNKNQKLIRFDLFR